MSQASARITVTALPDAVSYNAAIVTTMGSLFQQYSAQKVAPDFTQATQQLVLTYIAAYTGNDNAVPPTIAIYWDGTQVEFDSLETGSLNKASAGLAAGTIKIYQKGNAGTQAPWMIAFVKNIAVQSSNPLPGHTLRIDGVFPSGSVSASSPFLLLPITESGVSVHITAGSNDRLPFTVNQNEASSQCTLVASVFSNGEIRSSPGSTYTYQWYKKDHTATGGWATLAGKTQQTLTVSASDVDTYAEYKVEMTHNGIKYTDTASVMDVGDPYYIATTVTDGTNTATPEMSGDAATVKRVFTASLASRSGGAVSPMSACQCHWVITTVDGVVQNNFTGNTNASGVASKNYDTPTLTLPLSWMRSLNAIALYVLITIDF